MDAKARRALKLIQGCVDEDRIVVLRHFVERMDQRGLFWADIEALIDAPSSVRSAGDDDYGRPKWIIGGAATDGHAIDMVCTLDRDERGDWTVSITTYWQ